jgi:AraC-like DNA-binding protein/tetratricopeptide (TPR) repeat protein
MRIYRNARNHLEDRKLHQPVILCCIFLLLTLLSPPVQAQPIPLSAKILIEKGDSCRLEWKYNKALVYYQQAFNVPGVTKDVDIQLQLLERIMRTHDVLRHWKEMPESSYRLYMLAKEHGDSAHAAMALFMRGKRLHSLGQKQSGLQIALNATEMLKHTDYDQKNNELTHLYAILARMYCTDDRYDEALRMSKEQERYVELSKTSHSAEWYHRNLLRTYTIRLEILSKMGRLAEADSIYVKYGITPEPDPLCGTAVLSYYRLRGMNDEAMQYLNTAMKNLCEDGDTIGRNMQRLLDDLGDEYFSIGDYRQAAEYYASTIRIADTLAARSLGNLTNEVYKVIDNERAIAKHTERLTIIIAGMVLLVVVLILMLRQALIIRRKNQRMTATIRQLMHYRDIAIQNKNNDEMGKNETENVVNEELSRFKEVDKRIMKERLFTNPNFGRDDLMRLLGVDKNTLPTILQNYTGTNVPGYINIKRMEYAVSLIKEHPEYTLVAIAEACGIKSPATFIRNFKATYDMTPSEYRHQLEKGVPSPY